MTDLIASGRSPGRSRGSLVAVRPSRTILQEWGSLAGETAKRCLARILPGGPGDSSENRTEPEFPSVGRPRILPSWGSDGAVRVSCSRRLRPTGVGRHGNSWHWYVPTTPGL